MHVLARVIAVNISAGGIPKRNVGACDVTFAGLRGDRHDHAKHDSPLQAVSLLDVEMIESLRGDGFDLSPGATGENVTLADAEIQRCIVGDRLSFSGGLEIEITKVRKPCSVLDAIDPALKVAAIGRIGMLAKVLRPAPLAVGERVEVLRVDAVASR